MSQNSEVCHALKQRGCAHIKFIQLMSYLPSKCLRILSKPVLENAIQVVFEAHLQCEGLYGQLHLGYHPLGQVTADKTHQEPSRRLTVGHLEVSCGNLTYIPLTAQINRYLD